MDAYAEDSSLQPPILGDTLGRPLRDLRISVTDRCNFRCPYCMPRDVFGRDWAFLPRPELLSFEEIVRIAGAFVALGVEKIRITGGEPLLRRDLPRLVQELASLPGLKDLTLTTNGTLLPRLAEPLRAAGLRRLTVSLDSLDDATFRAMNDVRMSVDRVLDGIAAAESAGFDAMKVNAVIRRGVNETSILSLAGHFRGTPHIVRFIEYMDVGATNGWRMQDVVTAQQIHDVIDKVWPLEVVSRNYASEVAMRYQYRDGGGEVGIIASVTKPFCGNCSRARLTADGQLYTCLFATRGYDIRRVVRDQTLNDNDLRTSIAQVWGARSDRYSEQRQSQTGAEQRVEMSRVGG